MTTPKFVETSEPLPDTAGLSRAESQKLWAVAGGLTFVGATSTTTNTLAAAGATSLSATAVTGFSVGTVVAIGTTSVETATLATTSSSKTITFVNPLGYYHAAGAKLQKVTGAQGVCVQAVQDTT